MYSLGMATVLMYLASVIAFLLAVQYQNFWFLGMGLSAVFFIVATFILVAMMRKRADKQDF